MDKKKNNVEAKINMNHPNVNHPNVKQPNVKQPNLKPPNVGHSVRGTGSFGCVISPSLPCKDAEDDKKRRGNLVSKVFYHPDNAFEELEEYEKLNNFDKEQQYSIKPIHICQINSSKIQKRLLNDCEFEERKDNKANVTNQIFYEDGGESLHKYMSVTELTFEELAPYLTNLLRGIVALEKEKLVHFDIKVQNIVVNMKSKGKEIRLIDFGFCRTLDFIRNNFGKKDSFVWKRMIRSYFAYPIEFLYIPLLHELSSNATNANNAINARNTKNTNAAARTRRDAKIIEILFNKSLLYGKEKRAIEYQHHLHHVLSQKQHSFLREATTDASQATEFFKEHTPQKIDIFSLGIAFYHVYRKLLARNKVEDPVKCEAIVLPLFQKMTHPFVRQRTSAETALHEWEKNVVPNLGKP